MGRDEKRHGPDRRLGCEIDAHRLPVGLRPCQPVVTNDGQKHICKYQKASRTLTHTVFVRTGRIAPHFRHADPGRQTCSSMASQNHSRLVESTQFTTAFFHATSIRTQILPFDLVTKRLLCETTPESRWTPRKHFLAPRRAGVLLNHTDIRRGIHRRGNNEQLPSPVPKRWGW